MKCPYHDCQKDYNDERWAPYYEGFIQDVKDMSPYDKQLQDGKLHIKARCCHFCNRFFYDIHIGHAEQRKSPIQYSDEIILDEFLMSYPSSKNIFEAKSVPEKIRNYYNEAERCRSIGSLTGVGACLRKTIYAVCDDQQAQGNDYREKISNLSIKNSYSELLKQIKWLGDNTTKPGKEKYTLEMVDQAIKIIPLLIDELYSKDERAEKIAKLLANTRSKQDKEIKNQDEEESSA
jgi:hypothetical protein